MKWLILTIFAAVFMEDTAAKFVDSRRKNSPKHKDQSYDFFDDVSTGPNDTINHLKFPQYMALYHKRYGFFERVLRESIYYMSRHQVNDQVKRWKNKESSFYSQVNIFTDWTDDEKFLLGGLLEVNDYSKICNGSIYNPYDEDREKFPLNFSWKDQELVSNIVHQEKCSSDYAFSVMGAVESHIAIKTNSDIRPLSAQQILDCSDSYGNKACDGGTTSYAFDYLASGGKPNTMSVYPFIGMTERCLYDPKDEVAALRVKGCSMVPSGDEDILLSALVNEGPVSVGYVIDENFYFYKGGVYSNPDCQGKTVNHAMLLVGYGVDDETGLDYWHLKNSWGKDWGQDGYVKVLKDGNNHCGIASLAILPTI